MSFHLQRSARRAHFAGASFPTFPTAELFGARDYRRAASTVCESDVGRMKYVEQLEKKSSSIIHVASWWFQIFLFSPLFGEDSHFD